MLPAWLMNESSIHHQSSCPHKETELKSVSFYVLYRITRDPERVCRQKSNPVLHILSSRPIPKQNGAHTRRTKPCMHLHVTTELIQGSRGTFHRHLHGTGIHDGVGNTGNNLGLISKGMDEVLKGKVFCVIDKGALGLGNSHSTSNE